MGMSHLLPVGEGEQMLEAGVNADDALARMRNVLRCGINEEAQIPARCALDEAATFDAPCRDVLSMEPHMTYPRHMNACTLWRFERIREGDTGQFIALAFEPGLLRELFIAPLPGGIGRIEHALQRMTGYADFFPMISEEIAKRFGRVIDAIVRVLLDLADSPIPDAGQLKQPGLKLCFLRRVEA